MRRRRPPTAPAWTSPIAGLHGQVSESGAVEKEHRVPEDQEGDRPVLCHRREGAVEVAGLARLIERKLECPAYVAATGTRRWRVLGWLSFKEGLSSIVSLGGAMEALRTLTCLVALASSVTGCSYTTVIAPPRQVP